MDGLIVKMIMFVNYIVDFFSRERLERDQTALPAAGRVSRAQTLLPHDAILLRRAKLRVISHAFECLSGKIKDRHFLWWRSCDISNDNFSQKRATSKSMKVKIMLKGSIILKCLKKNLQNVHRFRPKFILFQI